MFVEMLMRVQVFLILLGKSVKNKFLFTNDSLGTVPCSRAEHHIFTLSAQGFDLTALFRGRTTDL
jgi:hypothetical protein